MATPRHCPSDVATTRGLLLPPCHDYWSEAPSARRQRRHLQEPLRRPVDTDKPAWGLNGTAYEEELFINHTLATIGAHDDAAAPLFLVHAFHLVHTPLQVPKEWEDKFKFVHDKGRRLYASMVAYMDDAVGKIVGAIQGKAGMWENTLLLFTSDNGGPIYYPGSANNHPLKGGKLSDWEGGVRANALLAGGALPAPVRGSKLDAAHCGLVRNVLLDCRVRRTVDADAAAAAAATTDHVAAARGGGGGGGGGGSGPAAAVASRRLLACAPGGSGAAAAFGGASVGVGAHPGGQRDVKAVQAARRVADVLGLDGRRLPQPDEHPARAQPDGAVPALQDRHVGVRLRRGRGRRLPVRAHVRQPSTTTSRRRCPTSCARCVRASKSSTRPTTSPTAARATPRRAPSPRASTRGSTGHGSESDGSCGARELAPSCLNVGSWASSQKCAPGFTV